MENKIGVIAIIVEDFSATEKVNSVLHEFRDYIIGRQGIPYKEKGVCLISIAIDAPIEVLNGLSGKLGMIDGVKSKVLTAK